MILVTLGCSGLVFTSCRSCFFRLVALDRIIVDGGWRVPWDTRVLVICVSMDLDMDRVAFIKYILVPYLWLPLWNPPLGTGFGMGAVLGFLGILRVGKASLGLGLS